MFRVKVLGLSPGAAPLPLLAGALRTLPGLGLSDDLCVGPTISFWTLSGEPLVLHFAFLLLLENPKFNEGVADSLR